MHTKENWFVSYWSTPKVLFERFHLSGERVAHLWRHFDEDFPHSTVPF
jgi:hypothetical protein